MIVSRTAQVRAILAEAESLRRAEAEASDFRDTLAELRKLHDSLATLTRAYRRVASWIGSNDRSKIIVELDALAADVRVSRADFDQNARQAVTLRRLVGRAGELQRELDAAWASAANDKVFPHAELLQLVESLPEMHSRIEALRQLRNRMRVLTERSPASDAELATFCDTLDQLRGELEQIDGLTPEVRDFLRRVVNENATLADLSDEVLAWCRQGNRAGSFRVELASPR